MFSFYHEFTNRLALMANLGWQDWSRFGRVDVSVSSDTASSLTTDLGYDDTWHAALGAQYRISDAWELTGGVAYDSAMLDEDEVTPALPAGDTWRFGLGTRYAWSQAMSLSGAYELAWSGDIFFVHGHDPDGGLCHHRQSPNRCGACRPKQIPRGLLREFGARSRRRG